MTNTVPPRRRKRRPKWALIILATVAVGALIVSGGIFVLSQMSGDDFEGPGSGEVLVTITEGESACGGIDASLEEQSVVKSAGYFCETVLKQDPQPVFQIGTYRLKKNMSAQGALDALLDPANKVELTATIPEGWFAQDAFERIADVTGIPLADFESAAVDYTSFGVPAEAPSIEGFLFPATYTFQPNQTAEDIIQIMVDRMIQSLDEHGVAVDDRFSIVTMASIIQREAGSNPDDFYKVSRVFWNRLDPEIWPRQTLESDATVSYGTSRTHTVWTTSEERKDASNLYNTYANAGLPIGPIGLPGDLAIDAAVNPADGPWLYFVPINLETGETKFSVTRAEHDAAADELAQWCRANDPDNESYCG